MKAHANNSFTVGLEDVGGCPQHLTHEVLLRGSNSLKICICVIGKLAGIPWSLQKAFYKKTCHLSRRQIISSTYVSAASHICFDSNLSSSTISLPLKNFRMYLRGGYVFFKFNSKHTNVQWSGITNLKAF